jgi:serine phosphatase RsbU (regulator of sigma subunit)
MNGDNIYLFTDGYADQFGGVHNKKFKKTSLKKLMIENSNLSMHLQKEIFESAFMDWKNTNEQIDDVTIIGYKHIVS